MTLKLSLLLSQHWQTNKNMLEIMNRFVSSSILWHITNVDPSCLLCFLFWKLFCCLAPYSSITCWLCCWNLHSSYVSLEFKVNHWYVVNSHTPILLWFSDLDFPFKDIDCYKLYSGIMCVFFFIHRVNFIFIHREIFTE